MSALSRRYKVFIVDDSTLMRDRLTDLLGTIEHVDVVGGAASPASAVARIRAGGIDAVLLDIDLEGGSGLDVLKAIKPAVPPAVAPVVIVLTIYPASELGSHCRTAGADYYFEKGGSFDGVCDLLEDLSRRHAASLA